MSALEDVFKGGNIATGLGAAIAAGVIAPMIMSLLRPLARSSVKAGVITHDRGRAAPAKLKERTSDVVAEAGSPVEPGAPRASKSAKRTKRKSAKRTKRSKRKAG